MAPSLQVLIDFLLAEIALCGDQGASVGDILSFTAAFYAKAGQDQAVDRRFQAKVWSWLTRHAEVSVGKDREANHLSFEEVEQDARAPRVFVSEERTWLAITGHEPDETKVLPTEFALLSIIASGKSNGIPQTDLVRLSGQDKRSVPKRTDVLQKKGYIQKRAIQVKSTRTSLCTLCKFLQPEYVTGQASTDQSPGVGGGEGGGRMVDFKAFTDKLFDILRDYKIVARNDLKRLLGFSDAWHWKVLSRALRKFERIGVLKRVKAMSQYQNTVNKLHPCVMLLRDPSDRDLEMFHEFSQNLFSNLGNLGQKEDVDEPDEDYEEEPERTGTVSIVKREESVEEAGRVLPTWTPDRSLYHIILDKVDAAGTSGVNNHGIVRGCFGAFFRRPLENTMARLVECWQLSQPLHLRHLAIVRDTILQRTNAMYVHYSFRNYKALVDAGEVSWEAVEFVAKGGSKNRVPPVDAVPRLDEYGFPSPHSPDGLFKNGNASLLECMAVCKPADYTRSGSDPVAVRLKDGSYALRMGSYKLSSHDSPVQPSLNTPRSGRPKGRPKGTPNRPRIEGQDSADADAADESEIMEPSRPPKKSKRAEDRLTGLSQREKLEALGMDETWTEYSVLLLERENPGVYVTPRGRRRPVGKSRGRPRMSQLAVFKSPKLASLPWFVEEKEKSEDVASASPREQSMETPSVPLRSRRRTTEDEEEITPRGAKRSFQGRESDEEQTPVSKGKQARREDVPETPRTQGVDRAKRKRQPSMQEVAPIGDADLHSKKRRQEAEDATANDAHVPPTVLAEGTRANLDKGKGQTEPAPESSTPEAHKQGKRGRTDRGGSVAVLRRKIIMDVVENAGGAFPMGTELWYPFTTTWMKTKFREKPDMRTVRTSVKHLIDAGKLRQQTFSGRDSKGIMVTKSIVAKPAMAPDDPVIKDLEAKMLAEGTRFYFPPNTEINPELTKSGAAVKREFKPVSQLPVETGVTVQLQQKPALVLAKERRVQRQLLERLESDEAFDDSQDRVHRLMTIQRRATNNLTSIARPGRTGKTKQHLRTSIPSMAQYAMLMNPRQTFNPTNGTFGTDAGLAVRRIVPRGRPPTSRTGDEGSPESLEALFARTGRHDPAQSMGHNRFLQDNDEILQWELDNQEAMSEKNAGLRYINQTVPNVDTVPIEGTIRFDIDEPVVPTRGPSRKEPVATRRRTRRVETENAQAAPPSQERRLEKLNEMMSSSTGQKSATRQPLRRNRTVATLPQSFVQRVMTAIVAVRVLAGGAEGKMVDWPLVSKCFPDHDPRFLQDRARNLLNRNRLQIAKMQGDFQERFLEGYASGKVPSIDYNDLDSYDWGGLVDWAQTQLDVPSSSEKLPDLPATRAQFDSVFELREEAPTSVNIDEVYQNTHAVTFQRKRALFASTAFAEPVSRKPRPRKPYLDDLATAKTWVRANVITPEESYRAQEARQALSRFGDALVTDAVHSLVTERVIKMGNRGRITPGRNYDITEPFISALRRRAIDSTQLRRAAEFKRDILDPRLRESGVFEVDYNAEDGDILALINLAANRRVTLKPRDPPRNQYGLTDGGYLTRQMDKRKLRFFVDVLPVSPVSESPVSESPVPVPVPPSAGLPSAGLPSAGLAGKIPLWIDIHGNHSALLWELVTAAVMGCVASRPGISASGIAGMVRPAAAGWEIQLLLEWMERAGFVQSGVSKDVRDAKDKGWIVKEWWWMCI